MKVAMSAITDVGMVREKNEDQVATAPELGLAVLADGMGGHQAGEVASDMAIDLITRHFVESFKSCDNHGVLKNETSVICEAIQMANSAIFEMAQERPECNGMGSTIVVTLFYNNRMYVGHVGDSRLYRFRDSKLQQVTEDHSVVQELLSRGLISPDEARNSAHKNLVTRALGIESNVEPDIDSQAIEEDDIYLLCSDGLNDVLPDDVIEKVLLDHSNNIDEAVKVLVREANDHGGPDNVSVVLVKLGKKLKENEVYPLREFKD